MLQDRLLEITVRKVSTRRGPARGLVRWGVLGLVVSQLLVGCARAAHHAEEPPPVAPTPSSEPGLPPTLNLTELESLEHDLRESEARLDAELARKNQLSSATRAPAEVPSKGEAPASAAQESADSVDSATGSGTAPGSPARRPRAPIPTPSPTSPAAEAEEPGSPCDLGCRALASMQRTQARICAIAGPGPRCQSAIERVESATERVRRAGCECLPSEHG